MLNKDEHDTTRATWHGQDEHDTARTLSAWHEHITRDMNKDDTSMQHAYKYHLLCSGLPHNHQIYTALTYHYGHGITSIIIKNNIGIYTRSPHHYQEYHCDPPMTT